MDGQADLVDDFGHGPVATMNTHPPFEVTNEALTVVASLLKRHPELCAGLILNPCFELLDEAGNVEVHFEHDTFWMAYDSPEHFSGWPTVELCGQSMPIGSDALERLRGRTLSIQEFDVIPDAGEEARRFLVAAKFAAST